MNNSIPQLVESTILQNYNIRRSKTKFKLDPRNKPIMSVELENEIEAMIIQFDQFEKWREWGMSHLREMGPATFMEGPPGTGKTVIAQYIARRIGRGVITMNMRDIGSSVPGQSERMIDELFQKARITGNKLIFMDECEAIAWDRSKASVESRWMVGVIDELLMQVAKYKGPMVFATNNPGMVDAALKDRCFAILQVKMPETAERMRLWKQKIPERFPLQLTTVQIEKIASLQLSGRQIENAIIREASHALRESRLPSFQSLTNIASLLV